MKGLSCPVQFFFTCKILFPSYKITFCFRTYRCCHLILKGVIGGTTQNVTFCFSHMSSSNTSNRWLWWMFCATVYVTKCTFSHKCIHSDQTLRSTALSFDIRSGVLLNTHLCFQTPALFNVTTLALVTGQWQHIPDCESSGHQDFPRWPFQGWRTNSGQWEKKNLWSLNQSPDVFY